MAVKEDLRVSAKYKSRCSYFIINTQTKEKAKQMECFQIALEAISRSDVSRCLQMSPDVSSLTISDGYQCAFCSGRSQSDQ